MGKHCAAVELLLARMDSNPEEFTENGRWEGLIIKYRSYLPMQDRTAMEDKINALRLDVFHKDVMSKLLAEPNNDEQYKWAAGVHPGAAGAAVSPYLNAIPTSALTAKTITNVGAGSPALNLSRQSIKEIAAQLQSYASNTWKP